MNLWLAAGGAIVDGVLTEVPGVGRLAVNVTVAGDVVTLPPAATLGPFATLEGLFGAFGLFTEAEGGAMAYGGALEPVSVAAGQYLSFPAGDYTMTPASGPGGDVLTIGGVPLTIGGQPAQVG